MSVPLLKLSSHPQFFNSQILQKHHLDLISTEVDCICCQQLGTRIFLISRTLCYQKEVKSWYGFNVTDTKYLCDFQDDFIMRNIYNRCMSKAEMNKLSNAKILVFLGKTEDNTTEMDLRP